MMKKILLPAILLIVIGCDKQFEPELAGWRAYTLPGRPHIHLDINGKETTIKLPGDETIGYRFAQLTESKDRILLTQILSNGHCYDYKIIAVDTTGAITDTVYVAPPNTALNFKLAPNDSLLLLKTYSDNCVDESSSFRYTLYNRFLHTMLPDTIKVRDARGIRLHENVWSPDSKKVIISEWASGGKVAKAFVYDLLTKDTIRIDKGSNFIWSPTDNDLVTYIQDHSIYSRNINTGEKELIYEGKSKKGVTEFRWDPTGEFLMMHVQGYLLNLEAGPLQTHRIIYLSIPDKIESRQFFEDQRIDTWKP